VPISKQLRDTLAARGLLREEPVHVKITAGELKAKLAGRSGEEAEILRKAVEYHPDGLPVYVRPADLAKATGEAPPAPPEPE
jgi:hypothetical protein